MLLTYEAVLRDGRVEWTNGGPPVLPDAGVRVHVTLVDAPTEMSQSNGPAMAAALQAIADRGGLTNFDYAEWLESRKDRPLPGRDD